MATDIYDVTNYGAVPNSASDQTSAIKSAIDAALTDAGSGLTPQYGGTVYLPNGYYKISGTLLDPVISSTWYNPKLTIRGDMPGITGTGGSGTRLILTGNSANPIFKVHGSTNRAVGFQLEQISLEGGQNSATWVSFKKASFCGLKKVKMVNTKGRGIYGEDWLDSDCHDVYFDAVSDASANPVAPTVDLTTGSGGLNCGNLRFMDCRFANHDCYACWLRTDTKYVQFLGCNWFGLSNSGYANVRVEGAFQCSFAGCNFSVSGANHITATSGTRAMLVMTSTFRDAANWGINLAGNNNIIVANTFLTFAGASGNTSGSITDSGSGNIKANNKS